MNCVDSSGWIEFFLGSMQGLVFKPAIEQTSSLVVPVLAIFEVHRFLSRNVTPRQRDDSLALMRRATLVDLTAARAVAASETAQRHGLAMADAVMYSIAREFKATFWTQDVDYEGLPDVRYSAKS